MDKCTITVEVSRTVQVASYEPVTVRVTQTVVTTTDEAEAVKLDTYKSVTQSVKKYIDNEFTKYTQDMTDKKRK